MMRILVIFLSFFAVLSCNAAFGTTSNECGKKTDKSERLMCYDRIFKKEIKWQQDEQTDPINGDTTQLLILRSNDNVPGRFGGYGKGSIVVRCKDNNTVIMFDAADNIFIDHQKYGLLTYRLDQKAAKTITTTASTDSASLGLGSGSQSIPLLKEIMNHNTMSIRVTPYNKPGLTMEFDTYGLAEAIKPLRQACSW